MMEMGMRVFYTALNVTRVFLILLFYPLKSSIFKNNLEKGMGIKKYLYKSPTLKKNRS